MITITLKDLAEVNLILEALGELPAKRSFNVIKSIEAQYLGQQKEPNDPLPDST